MEPITFVVGESKSEAYETVYRQIDALLSGESDAIANLANSASVLKYSLNYVSWVGFYMLRGEELVLGPFQGKPACVRIRLGNGVCGSAATSRRTILVPDVEKFPGHIVCDPDSRSEIVVPIISNDVVRGVLDLDSSSVNAFDSVDQSNLERIAAMISRKVFSAR